MARFKQISLHTKYLSFILFLVITDVDAQLTQIFIRIAHIDDGASFINTAHINDPDLAQGMAVASDGIVFLANGGFIGGDDWGLWAYQYRSL